MSEDVTPFTETEMDDALALASPDGRERVYQDALRRYQELTSRFNEFTRTHRGDPASVGLEHARRVLHEQLILLAQAAGHAGRETFDRGTSEGRERVTRVLPGFQSIVREDAFDALEWNPRDGVDPVRVPEIETVEGVDGVSVVRGLGEDEVGIVFARRVTCRVPSLSGLARSTQTQGYARYSGPDVDMEVRGERERVRRAARLAKELGVPLVEMGTFSHNYREVAYGVVVDSKTFERVASEIRARPTEFGIRPEDLDAEVVERDWQSYQENVDRVLGFEGKAVYEHMYRKLNDPQYRISDKRFVAEQEKVRREGGVRQEEGKRQKVRDEDRDWGDTPKRRR